MRKLVSMVASAVALALACGGEVDVFSDSGAGSAQGGATSGQTSSGSAQAGAGQGGGSAREGCQQICNTQASLGCPGFDVMGCVTLCASLPEAIPWCSDQVLALIDCADDQPASSFMCNATGGAELATTACDAQQAAVGQCWYQGPAPDLGDACASVCASQMGLPCAGAQCEARCNQGLDPSSACNGAFAGYLACVAQIPSPMWQCGASGGPQLIGDDCNLQLAILAGCAAGN
jgi:hypothetical protein